LLSHPASLPVSNRNFLLCCNRNLSLCCDIDSTRLDINILLRYAWLVPGSLKGEVFPRTGSRDVAMSQSLLNDFA
ncbi:MAG: hypothetical protein WCD04_08310, partial [Terriglobia bacterium]